MEPGRRLGGREPGAWVGDAGEVQGPREDLLSLLSWCRLRAGLILLRHLEGKESAGRHQLCAFCHQGVRNVTVHCLGKCALWSDIRQRIVVEGDWQCLSPDELSYKI